MLAQSFSFQFQNKTVGMDSKIQCSQKFPKLRTISNQPFKKTLEDDEDAVLTRNLSKKALPGRSNI
jgi:hypothetical protein